MVHIKTEVLDVDLEHLRVTIEVSGYILTYIFFPGKKSSLLTAIQGVDHEDKIPLSERQAAQRRANGIFFSRMLRASRPQIPKG